MEYTKYEEARLIGARALQLSQGAPILVKLSEKDLEDIGYNPIKIAKKEYKEGVIPITIKRIHEVKEEKKEAPKVEEKPKEEVKPEQTQAKTESPKPTEEKKE